LICILGTEKLFRDTQNFDTLKFEKRGVNYVEKHQVQYSFNVIEAVLQTVVVEVCIVIEAVILPVSVDCSPTTL
jgi:hypothetical protein